MDASESSRTRGMNLQLFQNEKDCQDRSSDTTVYLFVSVIENEISLSSALEEFISFSIFAPSWPELLNVNIPNDWGGGEGDWCHIRVQFTKLYLLYGVFSLPFFFF